MKPLTARRINVVIGVLFGVGILLETMIGAASVAPLVGEQVPSWLQWAASIPLTESLWIDSLLSIVFIVWVVFQIVERNTLWGRPSRSRRGSTGGAAAGVLLVLVLIFLAGAFLWAVFGLTLGGLVSSFQHFLGGL